MALTALAAMAMTDCFRLIQQFVAYGSTQATALIDLSHARWASKNASLTARVARVDWPLLARRFYHAPKFAQLDLNP